MSHLITKIHLKALKTTLFQLLFVLSFTVFANTFGIAQDVRNLNSLAKPVSENVPQNIENDSITNREVNSIETDSIINDSLLKPKSFLEGIINYKAKDYTSINQKTQQIYLYNEAEIQYKDMDIKAGVIIIDYGKDIIYAGRLKDSLGVYTQHPVFKQGNDVVEPDSIAFSIKTKKALIWNSKTEQQGGRIISD